MPNSDPALRPLQLYVSIPFCRARCAFCDWDVRQADAATRRLYVQALEQEAEAAAPDFADAQVQSVYFAGGSPTALPQDEFIHLARRLRALYRFAPDAEVTVEAAPNMVNASWMVAFQQAGVTRLSLGLVTGSADELDRLGAAWHLGSTETSLILPQMYHLASYESRLLVGIPGQTESSFRLGIQTAVRFNSPEITLEAYRPAGAPAAAALPAIPDETRIARLLDYAARHLTEKGYEEYRPGVWAKPGHTCRHRLAKETDGDYLSFGLGTHSRTDGVYYRTTGELGTYLYHAAEPEKLYTVLGNA
jgi:oxygen-independent coproporphyrinogen-3 oxidase